MRLSSNLTIKIKLFDILFYNMLYFRELIKLIFWTHRIPSLTAAELPPSPRRLERSNAKNSNKTGKTETARIETGGQNGVAAWGQGQNQERSKGNKRFQKRRKSVAEVVFY